MSSTTTSTAEPMRPRDLGTVLARPPRPGVHSETGVLRRVLLDVSLRRPTDGTGCVESVAATLTGRGVAVLGVRDLLVDALGATAVRRTLVERVVGTSGLSPATGRHVQRILLGMEPAAAARALVDGLPLRDWDPERPAAPRDRFLLAPLPDSRSLHATAVIVGTRVLPALPPATTPETRRAVTIMAMLHRAHPALRSLSPERYLPDPDLRRSAAQLDGDDVQIAADGSLLVGIGHRSSAHGARQLARTVLARQEVPRVVVTRLLAGSRADRLDRLIAPVDLDLTLLHPDALDDEAVAWSLRRDPDDPEHLVADPPAPLRSLLEELTRGARFVELPDGGATPADHLPLEPGTVLSSAPIGAKATDRLERAGVEVVPLPEAAGPAGGLRRLVQPLQRDPAR